MSSSSRAIEWKKIHRNPTENGTRKQNSNTRISSLNMKNLSFFQQNQIATVRLMNFETKMTGGTGMSTAFLEFPLFFVKFLGGNVQSGQSSLLGHRLSGKFHGRSTGDMQIMPSDQPSSRCLLFQSNRHKNGLRSPRWDLCHVTGNGQPSECHQR